MTDDQWSAYLQRMHDENYQARWDKVHLLYENRLSHNEVYTVSLSRLPEEEQNELYAQLVIEFG